ncbi:MAG: outer membrane protein assembly factor BamD [Bryobacteraceae bacterium]
MHSSKFRRAPAILAAMGMAFLTSCVHHYETPITKNTQQPDKVLYDQAMKDINHGRYEIARISLQTLMNTYQSSEYLAKAKLAIADSWFREGGINGMAEAEAEYKDFILFYPNMPEAAEAQFRVCNIHYKQMDGSDRDWTQTLRANDECKAVLTQFPNSKYAPKAMQMVRNIQESLADHEFVVGHFYFRRDMSPAAANRLNALVNQYPLFSKADEALYEAGISYERMGPRFRKRAGQMFSRIVQDYPLSARAVDAKKKLKDLELPIPQANQEAAAREEYNEKHYQAPSMLARMTGWLHTGPDVRHASQTGQPAMHRPVRTYPVSIPLVHTENASAAGSATGTATLSATTVGTSDNALQQKPDARTVNGAQKPSARKQPLPTNHDRALKKYQAKEAQRRAKQIKKIEKERAKAKKQQHNKKEREAAQQNPSKGGVYSNPSGSGATQQQ